MLRIALREVREHLVRFALSVLAVTLGVAFVAGTLSLRQMLSSTFDDIVSTSVRADAYVRMPGSGSQSQSSASVTKGVPLTLAGTLADVDGVRAAIPGLQGSVTLVGADGTAVRTSQAPSLGIVWDSANPGAANLVGHAPQSGSQIVVESQALARSGLRVGDATKLVVAGQVHDVTVVGSLNCGPATGGATLVFLDQQTAERAFASDGTVPTIAVYADPGVSQAELVDRVSATVKAVGAQAITADTYRDESLRTIHSSLGFLSTFLMVFAGLALFVGAFIIANTFTMTVRQRLREFALLRAVGAAPGQVFVSIVVQAAVIGAVGSALGVAAGVGLIAGLRVVFGRMGMTLSGSVPLTTTTVVTSMAVGTIVAMLASVLPARRAALVPPVEAMRDELVVRDRSTTTRAAVGAVLLLGGAGAAWWASQHPHAGHAGLLLGGGAVAVLVGVLAVGPVLAPAVVRLLAAPLVAGVRPLGRLARGNVTRNPRRTASTAGALTIGMALVGAAAVLAASTQASVKDQVATEAHADFVLRTDQTSSIPTDLIADTRTVDGVAQVFNLGYAPALAATSGTPTQHDGVWVDGADPALFDKALVPTRRSTALEPVLRAGEAVVDDRLADDRGWRVGQTLTLVASVHTTQIRIGATMRSNLMQGAVVVPTGVLDALVPVQAQQSSTALVLTTAGADQAAVKAALVTAAKPYYVVSVMTADEFVSSLADQVQQVLVILYALLGLSVVIAGLGIMNTLALSVIERTREIGLLRAVGLGRLQLAGTITIESVLTALTGTAIGLAVGVGLAAAVPGVYADQGLSVRAVPWRSLVGMFALTVVVGVLAAVGPGVRAARLRVLDAITDE